MSNQNRIEHWEALLDQMAQRKDVQDLIDELSYQIDLE